MKHASAIFLIITLGFAAIPARAGFLEFSITIDEPGVRPFMRDIRARVAAPDGSSTVHPAFHYNGAEWKVRVRPVLAGTWRVIDILEYPGDGAAIRKLTPRASVAPQICDPENISRVQPVDIDPRNTRGFAFPDGRPYFPFGANLGWSTGELSFAQAFLKMESAGLNWTRIWMAHWSTMNLDWLPVHASRPSPRPGDIDEEPARNWDAVIALAEKHGVWLQIVLQHHGQYSLTNNSNWDINPWNKANGGFLDTPSDFFTSPEAIRLTKAKYRYIIARYGHSPAILAWELFNEVHWTEPMGQGRDDILGAWHDEMAAFLRANDPYRHLVTTSHDNLRSPVYASMDFLQPHIYAVNMQAAVRRFNFLPATPARPVFYGETGDENMLLSDAQLASGETLVRILWPAIFAGGGALPGQTWFWEKILPNPALRSEMRALATFIAASRLPEKNASMTAFSPAVACGATVPRIFTAGHSWAVSPATSLRIPDDGHDTPALADIPRFYIADPRYLALGFKRAFQITFNKPADATAPVSIMLTDIGHEGGSLRIIIDGDTAYEHKWSPRPAASPLLPHHISLPVPAGEHTIVLENTGDSATGRIASFRLGTIDLPGTQPALAACGLRSTHEDTVLLYIWHRENIFAEKEKLSAPAAGEVLVDDLPAGEWTATWWDMAGGGPAARAVVAHNGGTLRLRTPAIERHASVILEKRSHEIRSHLSSTAGGSRASRTRVRSRGHAPFRDHSRPHRRHASGRV